MKWLALLAVTTLLAPTVARAQDVVFPRAFFALLGMECVERLRPRLDFARLDHEGS